MKVHVVAVPDIDALRDKYDEKYLLAQSKNKKRKYRHYIEALDEVLKAKLMEVDV